MTGPVPKNSLSDDPPLHLSAHAGGKNGHDKNLPFVTSEVFGFDTDESRR